MPNKIGQIRIPEQLSSSEFDGNWSKNLLLGPTSKLTINAIPGTTFAVGQDSVQNELVLKIGDTNIFSIDVGNNYITFLSLHKDSYNTASSSKSIIIDYIYFDGEV